MSFFKKLKNRLTGSSSKIDEGLDAIVGEGGDVAPQDVPVVDAPIDVIPAPSAPEPKKSGILGRVFGAEDTVVRRTLDDDMLEQLEELLISADMGVDTALRVTANMAEGRLGKKLSVAEIKQLMTDEITRIMEPVARPMPLYAKKPQVVLVVGVNGAGKTTTIGKLASQFQAAGKKVVIAAGDTFRAAAVEQLQIWGDRAGVPVLTAPEGSDPASLAFDAMTKAEADGARVALGTQLGETLDGLRAALDTGAGYAYGAAPLSNRIGIGGGRDQSGAKFIRAGE